MDHKIDKESALKKPARPATHGEQTAASRSKIIWRNSLRTRCTV